MFTRAKGDQRLVSAEGMFWKETEILLADHAIFRRSNDILPEKRRYIARRDLKIFLESILGKRETCNFLVYLY